MRKIAVVLVFGIALTGCGSTTATKVATPTESVSTPSDTLSIKPAPVSATASAGAVVLTLSQPVDNIHPKTSFAVVGTSNSFEANTPWTLVNAATNKVVRTGSFTATGWGERLYPYRGTVSVTGLSAGKYLFTVRLDDPSGGEGNPVPELSRVVLID